MNQSVSLQLHSQFLLHKGSNYKVSGKRHILMNQFTRKGFNIETETSGKLQEERDFVLFFYMSKALKVNIPQEMLRKVMNSVTERMRIN